MRKIYITTILLLYVSVFCALSQENTDFVNSHYKNFNVRLKDNNVYNLYSFSNREKKEIPEFAIGKIKESSLNHKDFGSYYHPIYKDAVELADMRTEYQSAYLHPNGKTIFRTGEKPINYKNGKGEFIPISSKLDSKPYRDQIYRAANKREAIKIDKASGKTFFEINTGDISINDNTSFIQQKWNGTVLKEKKINSSISSIGEDGMFISNAFAGVDMQTILLEDHSVKTNYIIKTKNVINQNGNEVIFKDILTVPEGLTLQKNYENGEESGQGEDWDGELVLVDEDGFVQFHYDAPLIYDNKYTKELVNSTGATFDESSKSFVEEAIASESYTYASYRYKKISNTQYEVSVVVKTSWLLDSDREYPVVVDPTTFTGNAVDLSSLCAVTMSGSTPSDDPMTDYGPTGCHSSTTVLPAGYMQTHPNYPVSVSASYINHNCSMSNTFMTFYGPCGQYPYTSGFFFFCNTNFSGTCTGEDITMEGLSSRCNLTQDGETCLSSHPPSCSDQTITYSVCVQTRCSGGMAGSCHPNGTASNNVQLTGDFRVDVFADQIELQSITSPSGGSGTQVCPTSTHTLNSATRYGVPVGMDTDAITGSCTDDDMGGTYNYLWTQTGGPSVAGITAPNSATTDITFSSATAGTYTFQLEACSACETPPSGDAIMCDSRTFTFEVGDAIRPIVDSAFFCDATTGAVPVTNAQGGYTYQWYSSTLTPITTGASYTPPAQPAGTSIDYIVRATAPCNSAYDTVNVTWDALAQPFGVDQQICPGLSTTLNANCGGNCEWYDAASGGTNIASGSSYTTPNLASNTSYWVEYDAGGGCTSPREQIDVNVGALAVTATPSSPISLCSGTIDFESLWSGGSRTLISTESNTTNSAVAAGNAACTSPLDAGCSDPESSTLTSPATLPNPMVATTVQSICVTIESGDASDECGKDIQLWLEDPEGTVHTIAVQMNDNNTPYTPCFTLDAAAPMSSGMGMGAVGGPYTGSYIPAGGSLNGMFTGVDPTASTNSSGTAGTWTLWVNDAAPTIGMGSGCTNGVYIDEWSMTFESTPPIVYDWSGGNTSNLSTTSDSVTTFTAPGGAYSETYTVEVTDATGCQGTATVDIECVVLSETSYEISGVAKGIRNQISWDVDKSSINDNFILEKANKEGKYVAIAKLSYKNQLDGKITYYDEKLTGSKSTYRLKYYKENEDYKYSNIIRIKNELIKSYTLMPNPAKNKIYVKPANGKSDLFDLTIYSVTGKKVMSTKLINEGEDASVIDISNLSSGVYQVVINDDNGYERFKLIKE